MLKDLTINMMVKNEERYIRQTLRSVLPHVEHAVIFDTGSTDKTRQYLEDAKNTYKHCNIQLVYTNTVKNSIKWDGNHLNQHLTEVRNQMLDISPTNLIWQVDGDEIYTDDDIGNLKVGMSALDFKEHCGIQIGIKWCISDTEYVWPGPFVQTLRIFPKRGRWIGEFPNEFLYVDGIPITMLDPRCVTINPVKFLHMSIALHPERRPANGKILQLTEKEKQCLNI